MKSKKSQGDLITTVLLILIALAAVALIATFIMRQVRTSTAGAEQKQNCLKLEFDITRAVNGEQNVTVQRLGTGDVKLKLINVAVNGVIKGNTTAVNIGETRIIAVNSTSIEKLGTGQTIDVSAVLDDGTPTGYACPISTSETVAAA